MERAFTMGYAKALHDVGQSDSDIAVHLGTTRATVGNWRRTGFNYRRQQGSGRPRKTTQREDRKLVRMAIADPSAPASEISANTALSRWTVRRRLREQGIVLRVRKSAIPLTAAHKKHRLTWAMRHCLWRERQWGRVVWSDEASVYLCSRDRRLKLWLRSNCKMPEQFITPAVQGGGGRLLIWGAIWTDGRSGLFVTRQTMTSELYNQVLTANVPRMQLQMGDPQRDWLFMEDNAPAHKSRKTQQHKEAMGLRCIDWPARSPDLNPIEHVWSLMKNIKRKLTRADNMVILEQNIQKAWTEISQETINALINSMTRRVAEVIKQRGGNTHY